MLKISKRLFSILNFSPQRFNFLIIIKIIFSIIKFKGLFAR